MVHTEARTRCDWTGLRSRSAGPRQSLLRRSRAQYQPRLMTDCAGRELCFGNYPFGERYEHLPWVPKIFRPRQRRYGRQGYTSSNWWHELIVPNVRPVFPKGKLNSSVLTARSERASPRHRVRWHGAGRQRSAEALRVGLVRAVRELRSQQQNRGVVGSVGGGVSCVTIHI